MPLITERLTRLAHTAYSHKVIRYIFSGGFSAAVDTSVFLLVNNLLFHKSDVSFLGLIFKGYSVALVISFSCGSISSFLINKYFVFSARTSGWNQFMKALPVYLMGFAGNFILLKISIEYLHLWPLGARALAAVLVAFITFNLHKYFTFKQKPA